MDPLRKKKKADTDNSEGYADTDTEGSTLINRLLDFTEDSEDEATNSASDKDVQLSNIGYLENKSDLTQKLVVSESDFCVRDQQCLPDIVVKQILKYIPALDQDQPTSLPNYRLICRQWNAIIEDTSQFMKKITFPVSNPKQFLDLDIVHRKKVKSIKFMCPLKVPLTPFRVQSKYTKNLVDLISDTIEKVEFVFQDHDLPDQMELFRLVLENCGRLQEVIVTNNSTNPSRMFCSLPPTINIAAANKISLLSVDVRNYKKEDAVGLSMCLLKLPHLREIQLNGFRRHFLEVAQFTLLQGLCEYLKIYEKALHLQKLFLLLPFHIEKIDHWEIIILLLILCGKHSIVLGRLPVINLNYLLALKGSTMLPLQLLQRRPLFPTIINAHLNFEEAEADDDWEEQVLTNFDRLHSLNIRELRLDFSRFLVKPEELIWIYEIKGLESLDMRISEAPYNVIPRSSLTSTLRSLFSVGFPFLTKLELKYDVFGSLDKFPWSQNFPNLNELIIRLYDEIPEDLISQLTALESLTILRLWDLDNLFDESFTMQCENRFVKKNNGGHLMAPAIACFKQLKFLEIAYCIELTKDHIINGIAKCTTLEKLKIDSPSVCESLQMRCKVAGIGDDSGESDSE